jgi:hypothetical protein
MMVRLYRLSIFCQLIVDEDDVEAMTWGAFSISTACLAGIRGEPANEIVFRLLRRAAI